ncbi:MAG: PrsW family glutamic-type intramembrane protease, partial [Dehalococcoidia bacterium]
MLFVALVLIAFTPGIFWLWFYTRLDKYRPEPRRLLAMAFFLGMLSTIPAGILNTLFIDESVLDQTAALASVAMAMLLVVGPVEETSKFLAVRFGPYRSRYFDEPIDALVYGAAASLGFASLENLMYVLTFGPEVMIL